MSLKSMLQQELLSRVDEIAKQGKTQFSKNDNLSPKASAIQVKLSNALSNNILDEEVISFLAELFSVVLDCEISVDDDSPPTISMFGVDSDGDTVFFSVEDGTCYAMNGSQYDGLTLERAASPDEIREFVTFASKKTLLIVDGGLNPDEDKDEE